MTSRDDLSVRTGGRLSIELLQDIYRTLENFKTDLSEAQNQLQNTQNTLNDLRDYFDSHAGTLQDMSTEEARRKRLDMIKVNIKSQPTFLEDLKGLADEISKAARGAFPSIEKLRDTMYKEPEGLQHTLPEHAHPQSGHGCTSSIVL